MARKIDEIIIHCSATRPGWMAGRPVAEMVQEMRRWHVQHRGWRDVGYHWVIAPDGSVAAGRSEAVAGAHCRCRNAHSLGICLIGGHGSSATDRFSEHYTPEQHRSLRALIDRIKSRYPSIRRVSGHNEHVAKACPGFTVGGWLSGRAGPVAAPRRSPAQSTTLQAGAAQVAAAAGTGATALATLDGTAQIVALGLAGLIIAAAAWIMRERLRRWAAGDR